MIILRVLVVLALWGFAYPVAATQVSETEALLREAQTLRAGGFNIKAVEALKKALSIAQGDEVLSALVLNDLGSALQQIGQLSEARAHLNSCIELAHRKGRVDIESAAENNLGNIDVVEQHPQQAIASYQRSAQLAVLSGKPELQIRALINVARVAETPQTLSSALELTRTLPPSHEKTFDLLSIGQLFNAAKETKNAYLIFVEALAIAEKIGDEYSRAYALGYLGGVYEDAARTTEALDLTAQAIFIGEQLNAPEMLYRWYWQRARLLKKQGNFGDAIVAYRKAVLNLQAIRMDMIVTYDATGQSSFRKIFSPLFFELADLLLQHSVTENEKNVESYLLEARSIIEQTKVAELQDYFQDNCVASVRVDDKASQQQDSRTAIIYPIPLTDRLELLVDFSGRMMRFVVPVSSRSVTEEVRAFQVKLQKRTTREYLKNAQKLYTWLIKPVESELALRQIDTLVIVPDGALRTIPLAALHDGEGFLVERFAFATTPSLMLTDRHVLHGKQVNVLLNGLSESVQGFSGLPNVENELASIQKMHVATVLKNDQYVTQNVQRSLDANQYSVVHIASHGQFQSDPEKSFLLTHDGKMNMNQLEGLIAPHRYSQTPIDLLTLSACQTATGDDRAALGLAGVAIKAGARSALASLWYVNDQSSTALVSQFYEHLGEDGVSKAQALQQAQISLIRDKRYTHPGYWAAFLLIGNWH